MTAASPAPAEIARAAAVLAAGGLVAFPTETVYGLGADAANDDALLRIFAVKGRPTDHPLIVHFGDPADVGHYAATVSPVAEALAGEFWPGPLTLLLAAHRRVSRVATGGRETVGLRVPAHPVALALLDAFGGGVAAPSANRFGRVSPTTAAHVRDEFGGTVDMVLDGGPCTVGVESTIVDCTTEVVQILRPGGVTREQIEAIAGRVGDAAGPSRAPGMLESHYAPRCRLTIVRSVTRAHERLASDPGELLDLSADAPAAAHDLYALLRDLDRRGVAHAVIVEPERRGIGAAVVDRLHKAAARPG